VSISSGAVGSHGLRVILRHQRVRLGGQEREQVSSHFALADFPNRRPLRVMNAGKERQPPIRAEREPIGGRRPSGSVSFSEKLVNGMTRRLAAGPSHRRRWGEAVLRKFVTPGSRLRPFSAKTADGMPHRAIASSRPPTVFRTIGAE
jgi:hypothetical protein